LPEWAGWLQSGPLGSAGWPGVSGLESPSCRRAEAGRPNRLGSGRTEIVSADRESWLPEKGTASEASVLARPDPVSGTCLGPWLGDRAGLAPRHLVREAGARGRPGTARARSLATAGPAPPDHQSRGDQNDRDAHGDQLRRSQVSRAGRGGPGDWGPLGRRSHARLTSNARADGAGRRPAGRPRPPARILSLRRGTSSHQSGPCRLSDPASGIHGRPGMAGGFTSPLGSARFGRGSQRPVLDRGVCQGPAIAGSIPRTGRLGDWP